MRTQSQQIASRMIERGRECGGKIARPCDLQKVINVNRKLTDIICLSLPHLDKDEADWVMKIAVSSGQKKD